MSVRILTNECLRKTEMYVARNRLQDHPGIYSPPTLTRANYKWVHLTRRTFEFNQLVEIALPQEHLLTVLLNQIEVLSIYVCHGGDDLTSSRTLSKCHLLIR